MRLPNLSNMVTVGQLRYIQSAYERPEHRNPDVVIGDFLPPLQLWGSRLRGRLALGRLRSDPFYYYVLARTKYYDEVFIDGIAERVDFIVHIGCGCDTRAYRFGHVLKQKGIGVVECDQPEVIFEKQRLAAGQWPVDHVEYLPIDLNGDAWPDLGGWLRQHATARTLVLMEGVTPYVDAEAFGRFLDLLAAGLPAGNRLAYDFKLRGVADDFGKSARTRTPFRLAADAAAVADYHRAHRFSVEHFELSADLSRRLAPNLPDGPQLFREDALVRLVRC